MSSLFFLPLIGDWGSTQGNRVRLEKILTIRGISLLLFHRTKSGSDPKWPEWTVERNISLGAHMNCPGDSPCARGQGFQGGPIDDQIQREAR